MNRGFIAVVALVVVVIGAVGGFVMFRHSHGPLPFTLTFKDAKQLRTGQFVVYKGVRVGEVKRVELSSAGVIEVDVVIDSAHRTQICQESTFRIEKPSLMDLSGEHQVTVSENDGRCSPIVRNSMLQGSEGTFDDMINKGKQLIESLPSRQQSH